MQSGSGYRDSFGSSDRTFMKAVLGSLVRNALLLLFFFGIGAWGMGSMRGAWLVFPWAGLAVLFASLVVADGRIAVLRRTDKAKSEGTGSGNSES